jgi:hypothetical protein
MTFLAFMVPGSISMALAAELAQRGIVVAEGPTDQVHLGSGDITMERLDEFEPMQPALMQETHRGKVVAQWKRERRGRRS